MIVQIISILIQLLSWAIIARIVLAWLPGTFPPDGQVMRFLFSITEPILAPIRKLVHKGGGAFDLSPMIAIVLLFVISLMLGGGGLF